jgi:tRNA threonylcarbamoyladenosine modification (KEOPS) complex  Pcc1 subunit
VTPASCKLGLALAASLLAAACNPTTRQIAPGVTISAADDQPVAPGATRIRVTNPDREKWTQVVRQGAPDGSVREGFACKVLACPDPANVIVTTRRSPTARPDPKALEKLAKEQIPKLVQAENLQLQVRSDNKAKVESLSSQVVKVEGYPAVFSESKLTVLDRSRFVAINMVFAGRVMLTIRAEAGDRATAKAATDAFARSIRIEEGPPLQPAS